MPLTLKVCRVAPMGRKTNGASVAILNTISIQDMFVFDGISVYACSEFRDEEGG